MGTNMTTRPAVTHDAVAAATTAQDFLRLLLHLALEIRDGGTLGMKAPAQQGDQELRSIVERFVDLIRSRCEAVQPPAWNLGPGQGIYAGQGSPGLPVSQQEKTIAAVTTGTLQILDKISEIIRRSRTSADGAADDESEADFKKAHAKKIDALEVLVTNLQTDIESKVKVDAKFEGRVIRALEALCSKHSDVKFATFFG
jgi:hypothetical protein